MTSPDQKLLSVRSLKVAFRTSNGELPAVRGIDFDVARGETVAIVGESGSGKSQTVMAIAGLLAANGTAEGSALLNGRELIGRPRSELDKVRGSKLTMIFQEPMTSLDPLYRIGEQMALPLRKHGGLDRNAARARAIELLDSVQIRDPAERIDAYPHELSGGQRQRVMIAMAIAHTPDILIADEPTTALDVTVQAHILELLASLQKRHGMAIVLISHDLGVVRRFADRAYVMRHGEIVEHGPVGTLLSEPRQAYTRALIDAEPHGHKRPVPEGAPVLLEAVNVRVEFKGRRRWLGPAAQSIKAVDDVSLTLRQGETLGIVGESGSGKSTLGRAILRLVPAAGSVTFEDRNLMPLTRSDLRPLRRHMQIVFQDPFGSLSPRLTAGEIVTEGLRVHEPQLSRSVRDARAVAAFAEVQLDPETRHRFPHEFSGGQRQRLAIARAMILKPKLVVLDEPTSALDRTVQTEILTLLRGLQQAHGLAYIFISHDLAMVQAIADRIIVMRAGKIVEQGPTDQIIKSPEQPYTRELMRAAFAGEHQ